MFHFLANPVRFNRAADLFIPWAQWLCGITLLIGFYFALYLSPPDYQQGETVRIMYIHVPCAWMALFLYFSMASLSAIGLIWHHPLAHLSAQAAAPIGACFTILCLATGSLWGKPMWGTWWVWDARLTSVLVLLLLYLGVIVLFKAFDDPTRGEKSAAILAIFGVINLPIIKFSVDWWNTLHQPASVIKVGGPAIHSSMMTPLFLVAAGFTLFSVCMIVLRIRTLLIARQIRSLLIQNPNLN
jgi:heme exporter protein C